MSYGGIMQFKKNLEILMKSEAFKNAKQGDKIWMGDILLRSGALPHSVVLKNNDVDETKDAI